MGKKRGEIDPSAIKKAEGGYFRMKCNRCDNIWYTKDQSVQTCPNKECRSPYWKYLRSK